MKTMSITGTRNLISQNINEIRKTLENYIKINKPERLYFGGATGTDTVALQLSSAILLDMSKENKQYFNRVELFTVFPDQANNADPNSAENARKLSTILELRNEIKKSDGYASYRIRNQYLVDMLTEEDDFLFAFPKKGIYKSGTWMTIHMAERAQKNIMITTLD